MPPPLQATIDDAVDVDDAAMLEEQYETEGSDFAMGFNQQHGDDGESTSIGQAPERPTEADMGGNGRDDW